MNIAVPGDQRLQAYGSPEKLGLSSVFTPIGISVMGLGVASGIPLQSMGKIYLGEALLIASAPIIALLLFGLSTEYGRTARVLLIAMIVSWIGYLISDIVRDTPASDYLRGWSKWVAMSASFASLAWIGSRSMNLIIAFVVGLSIGSCLAPFLVGGFMGLKVYWKFHAAIPVCILALIATNSFRPWVTIATLLGLTGASLALDTRFAALLCLATACAVWLGARRNAKRSVSQYKPMSKGSIIAAAMLVAVGMAASLLIVQRVGERYGYAERFQRSNGIRLANLSVAWSAIKTSPFIGYGSWPRDSELARERDKLVAKAKGTPVYRAASQDDLIVSHSQITQGWLEGGVLGVTFFVVLGWYLMRQLLWLTFASPAIPMAAAVIFIQAHCAWHLFFSPFSGTQRVYIPAACTFICFIAQRRSELLVMQRSVASNLLRQGRFAAVAR